ncbi:hypothetical protein S7335_743 [Synechococcus sp. PCC 7335]|uniref:hypothetical protein n=1 Tax=Synechococcus sp. (strain ATCC 29403 / PCC 7335) TaxID=91464 RepID=UPI00017EC463|nr:hypothetical protein [Synechococcus sp. PCC 7335]EDX83563.1 hypothetical protein S7335_743 [Synechococcus sp. PCC 7335]
MDLSTRFEQPHLDIYLRQLVVSAQNAPKGSAARQRALNELVTTLLQAQKLCRPCQGQLQLLYEDIYAEALQRLFMFVCDRIDDYSLEKGEVLQWVNFLLRRRFFIDASRDYLPVAPKGLKVRDVKRLTLQHLDSSNPSELNPPSTLRLSLEVKACLIEDTEGLFRSVSVVDHPRANFQYIAIKRLEGYSWQDLSDDLGVPVPMLSSFYRRCLARFATKLSAYLS